MGLTETGFVRPIQTELADAMASDERGTISAQLDTQDAESVIGNLNNIVADRLALAYEVLEEAYNGMDPENATDDRLVALALLTGTTRRGPQQGSVTIMCNLEASTTFDAGDLVVHAADDPENRWSNRDAVTTTTAGNYSVVFLSEVSGSEAVAPAATLTVIAEPIAGFNSATNAAAATSGTDTEAIEELRFRRESELSRGGAGTVDAIRADVLQVDGVIEVLVEENTTDSTVGALPPHSIRVVVWDGDPGAAVDDDIAQAIYATAPAGIARAGAESGIATRDSDGTAVSVAFARAEVLDLYLEVNIVSATGVSADDVKAALVAAVANRVGADVVYHKLTAAVFIDGVDDFTALALGTAPSPVGTSNIVVGTTQIAQLSEDNILVTGDAT
jgi:uncharacterized phage protein gp47/JayE